MNDTRIWSAAHMRALFPHKKPKCVHHLQAEDALNKSMTGVSTCHHFSMITPASPLQGGNGLRKNAKYQTFGI